MKQIILIVALAAAIHIPAMAQTCKPESITPSHPSGQYLDNGDGTVTDIVNALVWQKCSLGQTFSADDGICTGTPTHFDTWQDALQAAATASAFAGHDGWRLPNIKELGALVERSCIAPALDLSVFPSTPSAAYWSNTFDANAVNDRPGIDGRIIDFRDGTEFLVDVNKHRLIRMVRELGDN